MASLFDLRGSVALCTGATSGIGRRMALALATAGADIVLVGRRRDLLDDAEADIKALGRKAFGLEADLLDRSAVPHVAAAATKPYGPPTILVNAAGINLRQSVDEISFEGWDDTINLNLAVPFFLARECVPGMKSKGQGRIINIASLQSYRAFPNSVAYGASKGGIVQLTRAMAEAWSGDGITANAIAPGFFPTELTAPVYEDPDRLAHNAKMTAIGRNGELSDLDGATVFLASEASAYITGQTLSVDGGFTAK